MPDADVIVIGGGVVGLATAYELAGQGVAVRVFDKGQFGREASWAGAGILPPGNREFATTPEALLRSESCYLWPEWNNRLVHETGSEPMIAETTFNVSISAQSQFPFLTCCEPSRLNIQSAC